jgi:hypothetical protein
MTDIFWLDCCNSTVLDNQISLMVQARLLTTSPNGTATYHSGFNLS